MKSFNGHSDLVRVGAIGPLIYTFLSFLHKWLMILFCTILILQAIAESKQKFAIVEEIH